MSLAVAHQLQEHDRGERAGSDFVFCIGGCRALPARVGKAVALGPSESVASYHAQRVADVRRTLRRVRRDAIEVSNHLGNARRKIFRLGRQMAAHREKGNNRRYT